MSQTLKISARLLMILSVILFSLRPSLVNRVVRAPFNTIQSCSTTAHHLEEKSPFAASHTSLRCSFNREDKQQSAPVLVLRSFIDPAQLTPLFRDWSQAPTPAYATASLRPTILRI